ncbi:RNA polymerase sporulation-specific sigma factor [Alkalithermobacter thermoalcaliphilus JW-YL-7 = DSM 7308]|uniref:RNA polymerase sigma factor n=1 Tax=Alkalithermobacter thermoalcaliphilus JW-YL-7 = DSM 7308 TaxID=1121328 RepID=A0A150FPT0_CLOPD|nr:RNA polymerase, sigma 28 subunit, SigE [[Clostridium] paradoxum JW-YL-7 = DSM 7308]SHK98106.1 RNA polymerase sporulation-specific sigma factor [[Clostridium] paradoxum JW-YL-7 = DSM 7308]
MLAILKQKIIKFINTILNKLGLLETGEIHYLGGNDVLPPPLTQEEENELLKRIDTDESVRSILIERNLRLVVYISRKFENTGLDIEDLISIGTIGLIKAINTFKLDKNIKLATYASRCIENEILMYLRKNSRKKTELSFDEPLNVDLDGNELLLSDVLGTENDEIYRLIEEEIDKELLQLALDKLSTREKQIMQLRFGLLNGREKTQKEVANMLGISQSYISRLEKKIIFRLKKEMKKLV